MFSKWRATRRLQGERPRTTDIGSWGVIQAARDLGKQAGDDNFKVSVLLAKAPSKACLMPLSRADASSQVDRQWETLKAAFSLPHSALLYHLRNHYALIYAWREWHEPPGDEVITHEKAVCSYTRAGNVRRQVLTARRRQKPSAWLDFEEVRETILFWSNYQILLLEKRLAGSSYFSCSEETVGCDDVPDEFTDSEIEL